MSARFSRLAFPISAFRIPHFHRLATRSRDTTSQSPKPIQPAVAASIKMHATKLRLLPGNGLAPSTIVPEEKRINESAHELLHAIDSGDLFRGRFTIYHLLAAV